MLRNYSVLQMVENVRAFYEKHPKLIYNYHRPPLEQIVARGKEVRQSAILYDSGSHARRKGIEVRVVAAKIGNGRAEFNVFAD